MSQLAVHSFYASLLREVAPHVITWSAPGQLLTAAHVLAEIEHGGELGARYAQAVLGTALKLASEKHPQALSLKMLSRIDVSPREPLAQLFRAMPVKLVVWLTMSRKFTAAEMASLLEESDPDAKSFASDLMRVARDVVGHRAAIEAEA